MTHVTWSVFSEHTLIEQGSERLRHCLKDHTHFSGGTPILAETKRCLDCKQEFSVSEHGKLIAPYFEVHSTKCDGCGMPLVIKSEENGRLHYRCPSCRSVGVASAFSGSSDTYCPYCHRERRKKNRRQYVKSCVKDQGLVEL